MQKCVFIRLLQENFAFTNYDEGCLFFAPVFKAHCAKILLFGQKCSFSKSKNIVLSQCVCYNKGFCRFSSPKSIKISIQMSIYSIKNKRLQWVIKETFGIILQFCYYLSVHTYISILLDHKLRVQHVHSSFFHPLVMSVSIICPFIFCSHSFTFCDDNLPRRRKNKTEFSPIFPHMFQIYCFYILTFHNHIFCQNSHFDHD